MSSQEISLTNNQSTFHWPKLRFSIRTLLIFVLLLALLIAGLKWHVDSQIAAVEREYEAIIAIEATGAAVDLADKAKPILGKTPGWLRRFFTSNTYQPVRVVHLNNFRVRHPVDELLLQLKDHLEALTEPERINLTGTNMTDQGLKHLSGMQRLREITMARTQVTDAGLAHLQSLTALEMLGLAETKITGAGLAHLRPLQNLTGLSLGDLPITDEALIHLRATPKLQYLILSNTKITDQGVSYLTELKELHYLDLRETRITNESVKKICRLPGLAFLYLGSTNVDNAAINDLLSLQQPLILEIEETLIDSEGHQLLSTKLPNCRIFWTPRPK